MQPSLRLRLVRCVSHAEASSIAPPPPMLRATGRRTHALDFGNSFAWLWRRCCRCLAVRRRSEPYPNRPVRLIAPAGPGGNPDVLGRLLAEKFTDALGKPFVVENMPGAGGVVAANVVAKATPTAMC